MHHAPGQHLRLFVSIKPGLIGRLRSFLLRKVNHSVHRGVNPPRWAIGSSILIISWLRSSEMLQRIALPRDSPAAIRRISGTLYHVLLLIVSPSLLEGGIEGADSLQVRSTEMNICTSQVSLLFQLLRGHRTGNANQTLMHVEQVKNGLRTRHGRVDKTDDSYSMLERFEFRRGLQSPIVDYRCLDALIPSSFPMNQRDHALSTALGALRHYRTKRASVTSSDYHLMQLATYTAVQLYSYTIIGNPTKVTRSDKHNSHLLTAL
jgi:hypothetical protein